MKILFNSALFAIALIPACKGETHNDSTVASAEEVDTAKQKLPDITGYLGQLNGTTKDGIKCGVYVVSANSDEIEIQFSTPVGGWGIIHDNLFAKAIGDGKNQLQFKISKETGNFGDSTQTFFVPNKPFTESIKLSWNADHITAAEVIRDYPNGKGWDFRAKTVDLNCSQMTKIANTK